MTLAPRIDAIDSKYTTTGIVGKTDGAPSTGMVGEQVRAVVTTLTTMTAATGAWQDAATISLTAGIWDISAVVSFVLGTSGTCSSCDLGISATSGNFTTGLSYGDNWSEVIPPVALCWSTGTIPQYRVNLSSATPHYLKISSVFSGGVNATRYYCRITAVRVA